jgi:hypothetical protein
MPVLDLIKQAEQVMRACGTPDPATLWRVGEDCTQSGFFAADSLQKRQTLGR